MALPDHRSIGRADRPGPGPGHPCASSRIPSPMTRRALLAWSWTCVVLFLCWLPRSFLSIKEHGPKPWYLQELDKVVHFGMFAVWGFLWARSMRANRWPLRIFFWGVALAVITELGQELP